MNKQIQNILACLLLILFISCLSSKTNTPKASSDKAVNPEINRDNYYNFYTNATSSPITTNWLRRHEAIPIIIDELNKLGYKTFEYTLYELSDSTWILADVYNRDNDLAIVYNEGHAGVVKKEQRAIRVFNQDSFKSGGKLGRRKKYDNLPSNIIVLQETWYWYQYNDENSKGLLNKSTIIEILRQDIRAFVKEFENNKK